MGQRDPSLKAGASGANGLQPELDRLSDLVARLITGGAPGVAARERGDADVEPVLIELEDDLESLNELSLGHGGFIIRDAAHPGGYRLRL